VVVIESLDRLSRDVGDLNYVFKEMEHADVDLAQVHEGKADQITIGVRGLVGALFLKDLAHKVRRGASGKIRAGQRAGGVAYGYRPVLGKPGESTIHEPEAEIVRRIFRAYAEGKTRREIAGELNADGVPAPRGGVWRASTLGGGRKRGDPAPGLARKVPVPAGRPRPILNRRQGPGDSLADPGVDRPDPGDTLRKGPAAGFRNTGKAGSPAWPPKWRDYWCQKRTTGFHVSV